MVNTYLVNQSKQSIYLFVNQLVKQFGKNTTQKQIKQ